MTEEKWYHYWWYSINGLSNEKKKLLSKNKINPEDIYNIEETKKKYPFKEWFTEEEIEKIKTSRAIKEWKKEYRKMQVRQRGTAPEKVPALHRRRRR